MKQAKVNYKKFDIDYTSNLLNNRREYAIFMAKSNEKVNYLYESKENILGFEKEISITEIKTLNAELIWKR